MKKIILLIFSITLILSCSKPVENKKKRLTIWCYFPSLIQVVEDYNKSHPDVEIIFKHIPDTKQGFTNAVDRYMRKGIGAPDIFISEISKVREFVDKDYWVDVSDLSYGAEELVQDQIKYVVDFGRDENGHLRGLSWQATPGAVIYNRKIAKEYFGSDDPDVISKLTGDWDSFFRTAEKLAKDSNGEVSITATFQDIAIPMLNSKKTPWIVNNKVKLDDNLKDLIANAKIYEDYGYYGSDKQWWPSWFEGMSNDKVFIYMINNGWLNNVFKPKTKGTGEWGIAEPPANFYAGGAWAGITQVSQNKELAWDFIKFLLTNEDMYQRNIKKGEQIHSNILFNNNVSEGLSSELLGGQNPIGIYTDLANNISSDGAGIYDRHMLNAFWQTVDLMKKGRITENEIEDTFVELAEDLIPNF